MKVEDAAPEPTASPPLSGVSLERGVDLGGGVRVETFTGARVVPGGVEVDGGAEGADETRDEGEAGEGEVAPDHGGQAGIRVVGGPLGPVRRRRR